MKCYVCGVRHVDSAGICETCAGDQSFADPERVHAEGDGRERYTRRLVRDGVYEFTFADGRREVGRRQKANGRRLDGAWGGQEREDSGRFA